MDITNTTLMLAKQTDQPGGGKVLGINEHHCDPMTRDNDDNTCQLHIAMSAMVDFNIAQYLISARHTVTLMHCENNDGDTVSLSPCLSLRPCPHCAIPTIHW